MSMTLFRESGQRHAALKVTSLQDEIVHALRDTGYHQLHDVRVRADAGNVHLSGRLPSYYLKQKAHQAVLGVPGVVSVVDEIDIVN